MRDRKNFFAEQLRKILYEKHITQTELAKKLNVVQQRVSSWVTGTYNPKVNSIKKIAAALDVPFNYFIEDSGLNSGINPAGNNKNNETLNLELLAEKIKRLETENTLLKTEMELFKKEIELLKKEKK